MSTVDIYKQHQLAAGDSHERILVEAHRYRRGTRRRTPRTSVRRFRQESQATAHSPRRPYRPLRCRGSKRVFALAQVTSEVYENKEFARWPYRVDASYLVNLPASAGVHIDEVSTSERDLLRSLMRASYIELRPDEYERAETKLRAAAGKE